MKRLSGLSLAVVLALGATKAGAEDEALAAALARVSAPAVRAHVEFLADDLLEGRDTGTRGYDLAARYVATQLALAGIAPAGDAGSFFQRVPLLETRLVEGSISFASASGTATLVRNEDFIMTGDSLRPEAKVTAPVVFAGFGVTAPKLRYDDYAGLDVKGKIVAMLSNAPARFPSEERAYHASRTRKAENAVQHGAVGLLLLRTPEEEARTPWARLLGYADGPSVRWTHPDGSPEGVFPSLQGGAALSARATERLFAVSPVPLATVFARAEKGPFPGFALGVTATLSAKSEHARTSSPNVVGLLEGSDPKLRGSYVVYSAHLDHVGVRAGEGGDRIHNGAYDNALGSAVVLEVARVLAGQKPRPRRSLLFLFVTAEEKGLLGLRLLREPADGARRGARGERQRRHAARAVPDRRRRGLRGRELDARGQGARGGSVRGALAEPRSDAGGDDLREERPVLVRAQGRAGRDVLAGNALDRRGAGRPQAVPRVHRQALPPALGRHVAADGPRLDRPLHEGQSRARLRDRSGRRGAGLEARQLLRRDLRPNRALTRRGRT